MNRNLHRQAGQAMTEFVISAAFVLVPLFIIVPALGKYIDMKHATIQAARYGAWEYTAHYLDPDDQPSGFTAVRRAKLPRKSLAQVEREGLRRYYSDTAIPVSTAVDRAGYQSVDANPLWRYHDGRPIFRNPQASPARASGSDPTPDPLYVFTGVLRAIDTAAGFVARIMNAAGIDAGFDATNPDGRFSIAYSTPVEEPRAYTPLKAANRAPLFLEPLDLHMEARAAVLTDGWSAGGRDHALYQSRGLVPTVVLDQMLNGLVPIQSIASTVLMSPELGRNSLIFGHMVPDEVHPSRLVGDDRRDDCPGGYCEY